MIYAFLSMSQCHPIPYLMQKEVYAIYSDYVMKNPFYELDMLIKVDLWEFHLRNLVAKYTNRAAS